MRNMNRLLIVLCTWSLALQNTAAQRPSEIERLAALRFAIANGFQVPPSAMVARETFADSTRPRPKASRAEFRERDATALAAEIGQSVRTGTASSFVTCRRRVCWAATDQRVLVVTDPEYTPQSRTVVGLTLYSRDSEGRESLAGAVVVVKRTSEGWVGESFSMQPFSVRTRLPFGTGGSADSP